MALVPTQSDDTCRAQESSAAWQRTVPRRLESQDGIPTGRPGFSSGKQIRVWEHNTDEDRLAFRFTWPHGIACNYDPINHCFWGCHTNPSGDRRLVNFTLSEAGTPVEVAVYQSPFVAHRFTDKDGRAWFRTRGWATFADGQVRIHQLGDTPFEPEKTVVPAEGPARDSTLEVIRYGAVETFAQFGITFELTMRR